MNQSQPTVALLSPGDMGHAVGRVLTENGIRVITDLSKRSPRTKSLAGAAGIHDVGSLTAVVENAQIIMAILVPAQALQLATEVAQAISNTNADLIYVDCNAVAPATTAEINQVITAAGVHFVDASIIGPPPSKPNSTRFYASGPKIETFALLNNYGLSVISLGNEIGRASAIKMCYAALTKGLSALSTELLTAAKVLGVDEALAAEFQQSQAALYQRMEKGLPHMPPKSRRWIGEMDEIAKTFGDVGLTPKILEGAAEIYRLVGETEMADRNPEDSVPPPTLNELTQGLAKHI